MMNKLLLIAGLLASSTVLHAQVFTNKEVGKKNQAIIDSLKTADYPYTLPIWGQKATAAGFELPYSAGISLQYFGQRSDLVIDNLVVGFNNKEMHNLDGLVRFNKAEATTQGITLRPDVWLFPFLNVYAVLGVGNASTDVGFGIWLPDSSGADREIFNTETKVEFNVQTFGLGLTPTIGVGGGFLALDMNMTWSDIPQLDKPAFAFIFDPRVGKVFKMKKPGRNLTMWVGGFRFKINGTTSGSLPIGDALPIDQWQGRVDQGTAQVEALNQQVEDWWNGLSGLAQANPVNQAKYDAANIALDQAAGFFTAADAAVANAASSTVQYSIDKRPKDMWNFIVGGQFQVNKHLMFRAEYGFLASRTQLMAGLQYRFGL